MDKATEYRQKAEYCQHMGESAFREEHRTEWLRLAESWLRMIRPHDHVPSSREPE
jgi:hypothetical protein